MAAKYKVGDKVLIKRDSPRIPLEIVEGLRLDHPRTIVSVFYDKGTQHTRYYLGVNKRGAVDLSARDFRASDLKLWEKGSVGRPKVKRGYKRH